MDRNAIVEAYQRSTAAFESAINDHIQWSPEAAAGLEDSIKSGPLQPACRTNRGVSTTMLLPECKGGKVI